MKFIRVGLLIVFLTLFASPVLATRSLSITSNKSSLFGDEEMTITASTSGFLDGETIFIKGAFYQSGLSDPNYFGYTKNGDTWVKNSVSNVNQRMIKIGEWDGAFIVKCDFSDSGYKGEGEYSFKGRFYWGTSSADWSSNALTITINEPDPTPTNSPTPMNTPTNSPQPTSTQTPTPTVKSTVTSTPKPTEKTTPTPTGVSSEISTSSGQNSGEGDILGAKDTNIATSSVAMERAPSYKVFIITFLFIGIGSALLSLAIVLRKQFFIS